MMSVILGFTVLLGIGGAVCYCSYKYQAKQWNDGYCPHCGHEWKLDEIDSTSRTYHCDNGHWCVLGNYNEK